MLQVTHGKLQGVTHGLLLCLQVTHGLLQVAAIRWSNFTELYKILQKCPRLYRTVQDFTEMAETLEKRTVEDTASSLEWLSCFTTEVGWGGRGREVQRKVQQGE